MSRTTTAIRAGVLLGVIGVAAGAFVYFDQETPPPAPVAGATRQNALPESVNDGYTFERLDNPPRTVVRDSRTVVAATMTDGARTVVITGPSRTFREPKATTADVTTNAWVRLAPQAWKQGDESADWLRPWLTKAMSDKSPDVLAVAMEYLDGAAEQKNAEGVRFRGDASFGPVASTGAGRLERSDFYDYLGVPWTFADGTRTKPDSKHYGAVDCSGFVRLVYGYRMEYPLLGTNTRGPGLPRRAYAIAAFGPGVTPVPNTGQRSTAYDALQPGDLVFFEVEGGADELDHAGIYLGADSDGRHRFMSSRERINGPTLGDVGGTSLLDDGGMYSRGFRAARRI
ncbi:cell wall-associated NlpC family hydrolase [Kibdelosporangium banguiense]|uniref:Cell wall-associated NlpC family hydrolase n=1 Tax=Kibdelosporangium banguiense TaxID=1365924 RepID=A0ABS4THU3_9PSEU|nr:NlpC/P60 family protein [Kibdelosporangium banguiense]MBP2323396.1 cell wall-associated NlpC family hydrolase [Kibdelosporangium banguiense]